MFQLRYRAFCERLDWIPGHNGMERGQYKEILQLTALGMFGVDIAKIIGLSAIYVAEISCNIMQKLGTRNKLAALCRARELKLI